MAKEEFRATAVLTMRVHRFAVIGTICGLLSAQDDAAIRANARSMLDERDHCWRPKIGMKRQSISKGWPTGHSELPTCGTLPIVNPAASLLRRARGSIAS